MGLPTTMTSRFRVALLAMVAAALAAPGVGQACISVHLSVLTPLVGPGGTVRYSISGLESGATYTVQFGSYSVDSGVADGGGVAGTFTMPDLGSSPRTIYVTGIYTHSDIPDGTAPFDPVGQVQYQPAAAPPPPAPPPAPPPTPPPAQQRSVVRSGGHLPKSVFPKAVKNPSPKAAPTPTFGAQGGDRKFRAPEIAMPVAPKVRHAVAKRRSLARPRTRVEARPPPVALPAPRLQPLVTAPHPMPAPQRVPWVVVAILVLLLLMTAGGSGWIVALRRRRPATPAPELAELELEAELQEIIAEERAKAGAGAPD